MSGKIVCLSSLAVALLGLGVARGQGPSYPASPVALPPTAPDSGPAPPSSGPGERPFSGPYTTDGATSGGAPWAGGTGNSGGAPVSGTAKQSSWIVYPREPGCCGPVGGDGPIGSEMYFRSGMSLPFGGGIFGTVLTPGWEFEGGARVLFFNPAVDAAWTVDLSLSNTNFNSSTSRRNNNAFSLTNVQAQAKPLGATAATASQLVVLDSVTGAVHGFVETCANAKLGREWYLLGSANSGGTTWRCGFDAGGAWGSGKADLHYSNPNLTTANNAATAAGGVPFDPTTLLIKHRTDVIGQAFFSLHSDIEIPCGCCIFQAGFRAEYGYTWDDILQRQNRSDLQAINLLFEIGGRF